MLYFQRSTDVTYADKVWAVRSVLLDHMIPATHKDAEDIVNSVEEALPLRGDRLKLIASAFGALFGEAGKHHNLIKKIEEVA